MGYRLAWSNAVSPDTCLNSISWSRPTLKFASIEAAKAAITALNKDNPWTFVRIYQDETIVFESESLKAYAAAARKSIGSPLWIGQAGQQLEKLLPFANFTASGGRLVVNFAVIAKPQSGELGVNVRIAARGFNELVDLQLLSLHTAHDRRQAAFLKSKAPKAVELCREDPHKTELIDRIIDASLPLHAILKEFALKGRLATYDGDPVMEAQLQFLANNLSGIHGWGNDASWFDALEARLVSLRNDSSQPAPDPDRVCVWRFVGHHYSHCRAAAEELLASLGLNLYDLALRTVRRGRQRLQEEFRTDSCYLLTDEGSAWVNLVPAVLYGEQRQMAAVCELADIDSYLLTEYCSGAAHPSIALSTRLETEKSQQGTAGWRLDKLTGLLADFCAALPATIGSLVVNTSGGECRPAADPAEMLVLPVLTITTPEGRSIAVALKDVLYGRGCYCKEDRDACLMNCLTSLLAGYPVDAVALHGNLSGLLDAAVERRQLILAAKTVAQEAAEAEQLARHQAQLQAQQAQQRRNDIRCLVQSALWSLQKLGSTTAAGHYGGCDGTLGLTELVIGRMDPPLCEFELADLRSFGCDCDCCRLKPITTEAVYANG